MADEPSDNSDLSDGSRDVLLRLTSSNFTAEELSELLGAKPTHPSSYGDPLPGQAGRHAETIWNIRSRASETSPLDDHIRRLFELVLPEKLSSAIERGVSGDVYVVVETHEGKGLVWASADILRLLAELNLPLVVDIHTYSTDRPGN